MPSVGNETRDLGTGAACGHQRTPWVHPCVPEVFRDFATAAQVSTGGAGPPTLGGQSRYSPTAATPRSGTKRWHAVVRALAEHNYVLFGVYVDLAAAVQVSVGGFGGASVAIVGKIVLTTVEPPGSGSPRRMPHQGHEISSRDERRRDRGAHVSRAVQMINNGSNTREWESETPVAQVSAGRAGVPTLGGQCRLSTTMESFIEATLMAVAAGCI